MVASSRRSGGVVFGLACIGCWAVAIASESVSPPTAITTEWGRVEPLAVSGGRFRLVVANAPADGRLAMPSSFAEIVRARLEQADPVNLPIEISQDATKVCVLLPTGSDRAPQPMTVRVDTADDSGQSDDGRIVLSAATARVEGDRAKLERQPGNRRIGFWSDAGDSVHWNLRATRWGRYEVLLTFSNGSPPGSEIEVAIGESVLTAVLPSTGGWYRYESLSLGAFSLGKAGDVPVRVRCTRLVGGAVMNLKAITLEPACEGTFPVQADDGVVTLHGRDSTVLGTNLRYEPAEAKQTLGYWTRSSDAAVWSFTVTQPATFDVEVLQGCGPGQGGSLMELVVDGNTSSKGSTLSFTVEDTGGFQAFRPRVIGRVRLDAGRHTLRVQPQRIMKSAACDIRQVRLLPAAPDASRARP